VDDPITGVGSRRLRIGVVGAGLVAQVVHLPQLAALDAQFELVAIAEPDEGVRARVGARHGIGLLCADHRELIERGAVDAVLVCSPDATHARIALDALAAGLHVLVEKPLCLTTDDADRIVAERDRTGLVVQVGYMKRFDPAYEALQAELADDPPELLHVTSLTYDPGLAAEFGPPGAVDRPADAFLGALVHDVNAVHGLLGGTGRAVDGFDCGDCVGGAVVLDDGVRWTLAWLRIDELGDFREHIALYGRDGIRELEFPAPYLVKAPTVYRRRDPGGLSRERRSWRESYIRQLEHFHDCVTGGAACRTPPEQARLDIGLLTALRHLAR
jgi:predicted dehydrogenase